MPFTHALAEVIGLNVESPQVTGLIARYSMGDVCEDLPFRKYVGADRNGICLLLENERVVDVQIYVEPTKMYAAFEAPPFGLKPGMKQDDVHHLLGQPTKHDRFDSKYALDGGAILTVVYNSSGSVRYLSIGAPL